MLKMMVIVILLGTRLADVQAQTISGYARVVDGDHLDFSGEVVELDGIDAPEASQSCKAADGQTYPCGRVTMEALRDRIGGNPVSCWVTMPGRDLHGHTLARCTFADGRDMNAWLVRQGYALALPFSATYRAEQTEAINAKRSLWAGEFVVPSFWRGGVRLSPDTE